MPLALEEVGVRAIVKGAGRYVADAQRVNASTATIGKTAKTTERRTVSMGESMRLGGTRMREMGTQAVFLGGALTALAAAPAFLAGRFESSFVKIENLVGESREALDELKPAVLALAGDTARAPQELAEALFVVESGGLRGAEALATLDASARAAALGMGTTGDIARVTTQAILAFRSQNLDAARAVNVLVGTARAGNFETSQLAGAFGRVLPLAAELGIRFSDLGAFIAAYTRVGGNATQATTALSAVLTSLTRGGSAAIEAMESVGLSLSELRRLAREEGLAQALFAILEAAEQGGAGAEERLATIIPNIRALRGVLATAGVQAEEFLNIQTELAGELDLLAEGFDRLQEDSMFRFEQSLNDIKVGMVEFGATFLPVMADAVEVASKAFVAFTALPDPIQQLIGTTALLGGGLIVLGGLFAIMLGSILSVTGSLLGMSLGLGGVTAALSAARVASIALTTTPLFLGVAAVTIGVFALAAALGVFSSSTDDAAEAQQRLAEAIDAAKTNTEEQLAAIRSTAAARRTELEVERGAVRAQIGRIGREDVGPSRGARARQANAIATLRREEDRFTAAIAAQTGIIEGSAEASEIRAEAAEKGAEVLEQEIDTLREERRTLEDSNRGIEANALLREQLSEAQGLAFDKNAARIADLITEEDKLSASLQIAISAEAEETAALDANTAATDANAAAKRRLATAETEEAAARRLAAQQIIRERGFAGAIPEQALLDQLVGIGDIDLADILGPQVTPEGAREIIGLNAKLEQLRQAQLTGEIDTIEQLEAEIALLIGSTADAVVGLTELQQALQSFGERRERERVEGLIRDLLGLEGPGLAEVRAAQSELDETFARIAPIIQDRLGVLPELFRDVLDRIVTEAETAALDAAQRGSDFGGILGVLLARRLAEAPAGLGPGAGLIAAPGGTGLGTGEGSEFGGGMNVEEMNINVGGGNNSPGETAEGVAEGLRATMAEQPQ